MDGRVTAHLLIRGKEHGKEIGSMSLEPRQWQRHELTV